MPVQQQRHVRQSEGPQFQPAPVADNQVKADYVRQGQEVPQALVQDAREDAVPSGDGDGRYPHEPGQAAEADTEAVDEEASPRTEVEVERT